MGRIVDREIFSDALKIEKSTGKPVVVDDTVVRRPQASDDRVMIGKVIEGNIGMRRSA